MKSPFIYFSFLWMSTLLQIDIQPVHSENQANNRVSIFSNSVQEVENITSYNMFPILRNADEEHFDERISELISLNILKLAHNISHHLRDSYAKSRMFSPVSIMSALALLLLGTKGTSNNEITKIMGIDGDSELFLHPYKYHEEFGKLVEDLLNMDISTLRRRPEPKWRNSRAESIRNKSEKDSVLKDHIVRISNGLFLQNGYILNPDYQQVAKAVYRSEDAFLDFQNNSLAARNYINNWVCQNTFSKIPNIISDDISKDTKVIIASVLYFKGFWENDFFESATIIENFYPDGHGMPAIKAKMMSTGGVFPYYKSEENDCRIIGLPYKGNLTTLYVIQPNSSTREKLKQMQSLLTANKIDDMISNMTKRSALIAFPKLHITDTINLKEILLKMGISDIFSKYLSDLSIIGHEKSFNTEQIKNSGKLALDSNNINLLDRFNETALIFSRFGDINITHVQTIKRLKRTLNDDAKKEQGEAVFPNSIQTNLTNILKRLEKLRLQPTSKKSDLYVEDIRHKIDFVVNEQGTEAAAATVSYLKRSGADVTFRADTPFMILLRHDITKFPLFYGIINEPVS